MAQAPQDGGSPHQNPAQAGYAAFEGTRPVAERQRFDTAVLAAWLRTHVEAFDGPLTVEQFAGGQSNPSFKLVASHRSWVMRAKPRTVL